MINGLINPGGRGAVDNSTGAIETITYPHHEIHEGNHFYIEGHTTLANAEELRVKLVTPDTAKWAHFLWEISSNNILTTELWEGASGGMTGGSGVTPLNNNRNSPNASVLVITSGVAVATSDGLKIGNGAWGSRDGGSQIRCSPAATGFAGLSR